MEVLSIQNQFQCSQYTVEDWHPKVTATISPPQTKTTVAAVATMSDPAVSNTQKPYDRQLATTKLIAKQKSPVNGQPRRSHSATFNYNNNNCGYLAAASKSIKLATCDTAAAAAAADDGDVDSDGGAGAPTFCCQLNSAVVQEISLRLQSELRMAKSRHLTCTEVSLPWELTPRIAVEIIKISEREPCGVRGSTIFIEFEHEPAQVRRIASFKVDPNTLSTFELYVTLKQDKSSWISRLPQFLKNLTRCSTILISSEFTITKNKLYSCE